MNKYVLIVTMFICLCFASVSVSLGQTEAPTSVEEEYQLTTEPNDAPSLPSESAQAPQQEPQMGGEPQSKRAPSSFLQQLPLLLMLGAAIFFMIWTAKRYPISGIAGWLLLPAIGLVLGPVIAVIVIIVDVRSLPNTPDRYLTAVRANIFKAAVLGAFSLYAANSFFRRKKGTSHIMIWWMVANVLLSVMMIWNYGEIFVKSFIFAMIQAAIWIPYFLVSKRVKATFCLKTPEGSVGEPAELSDKN